MASLSHEIDYVAGHEVSHGLSDSQSWGES